MIAVVALVAVLDILASPTLGFVRDHVVHAPELSLLLFLSLAHVAFSILIGYSRVGRNLSRKKIIYAAIPSSPAVVIAFAFDAILYWQLVF